MTKGRFKILGVTAGEAAAIDRMARFDDCVDTIRNEAFEEAAQAAAAVLVIYGATEVADEVATVIRSLKEVK